MRYLLVLDFCYFYSSYYQPIGHYYENLIQPAKRENIHLSISVKFFLNINSLGDHFADLQNGGVFRDFDREGVFLGSWDKIISPPKISRQNRF